MVIEERERGVELREELLFFFFKDGWFLFAYGSDLIRRKKLMINDRKGRIVGGW